jgi:ring-1,2-phenylacetyl-CoA epoxidase subunit PaaD
MARWATQPSAAALEQAVAGVEDPELPVSIADLGMVRSVAASPDGRVVVALVPTFLACPARWMVEADVRRAVEALPGVVGCRVEWMAGGWSGNDVTARGRAALADVGMALPGPDGSLRCPFCGSAAVSETSPFGSAVCRTSAFCADCRTPLEVLKTKRPVSPRLPAAP